MALSKGEEELAREALTRRQQSADRVADLSGQLEAQEVSVAKLFEAMQLLESKINEARSKKDQVSERSELTNFAPLARLWIPLPL